MADLPHPLSALLQPDAYNHPVARIELVETHISWVLLTGELAYKIKRPVQRAFVDLRSPERRAFFCHEEIRLNRRFAPDLYLDVCKVTMDDSGHVHMGGEGRVIEHAVRMKQFDRAQELDRLLDAGSIDPSELARFGKDIAAIHALLPIATPDDEWGRADEIARVLLGNLAECERDSSLFGTSSEIAALALRLQERVHAANQWMTERREQGRVRECHGDLHARNILRRGSRLVAFDCMEFAPGLRWIDVADEIAFLVADLAARGHASHAHAFLNSYLAASGDYHACRFLDVYRAHRALVRAKVEALTAADKDANERARAKDRHVSYVRAAHEALTPRRPSLILMHGLSGSGKTWLAERIAGAMHAIHVRSDVERRRLFDSDTQRYTPENVSRVYEYLATGADDVLAAGYDVVVDASFRDRDERARFRKLAMTYKTVPRVVYCHASDQTLRARIEQRRREGADASEADEAVLSWQRKHFDPILDEEMVQLIEADTTRDDVLETVLTRIRTES